MHQEGNKWLFVPFKQYGEYLGFSVHSVEKPGLIAADQTAIESSDQLTINLLGTDLRSIHDQKK